MLELNTKLKVMQGQGRVLPPARVDNRRMLPKPGWRMGRGTHRERRNTTIPDDATLYEICVVIIILPGSKIDFYTISKLSANLWCRLHNPD